MRAVVAVLVVVASVSPATLGLGAHPPADGLAVLVLRLAPVVGVAALAVGDGVRLDVFGRRPVVWWTALVAWSALTAPWSIDLGRSLTTVAGWACAGVIAAWAVQRLGADEAMRALLVGLVTAVVGGVAVELVAPTTPLLAGGDGLAGIHRLAGLTPEPLDLAELGALTVAAAVGCWRGGTITRHSAAATAAVGTAAVVAAQGRFAVAVVAGCLVVAAERLLTRRRFYLTVTVAASVGLLAVVGFGSQLASVAARERDASDLTNLNDRVDVLWPMAFEVAGERPVIGWGAGTVEVATELADIRRWRVRVLAAHNRAIDVVVGGGWVALALWVAGVIDAVVHGVRRRVSSSLAVTGTAVLALAMIGPGSEAAITDPAVLVAAVVVVGVAASPTTSSPALARAGRGELE